MNCVGLLSECGKDVYYVETWNYNTSFCIKPKFQVVWVFQERQQKITFKYSLNTSISSWQLEIMKICFQFPDSSFSGLQDDRLLDSTFPFLIGMVGVATRQNMIKAAIITTVTMNIKYISIFVK